MMYSVVVMPVFSFLEVGVCFERDRLPQRCSVREITYDTVPS